MNRAAFHRVSSLQQKCQRGYSCSFNVSTTEEDAERVCVCDFTALFGAERDWSSFPKRFNTLDLDDSLTRVSSDMKNCFCIVFHTFSSNWHLFHHRRLKMLNIF